MRDVGKAGDSYFIMSGGSPAGTDITWIETKKKQLHHLVTAVRDCVNISIKSIHYTYLKIHF